MKQQNKNKSKQINNKIWNFFKDENKFQKYMRGIGGGTNKNPKDNTKENMIRYFRE